MSYTIPADSPKREDALRWSVELQRALTIRGLSMKALNRALGGTSQTKLWHYKAGRMLPRLRTALEIAEALQWPSLAEMIREMRSRPCVQCGRMFVMEGGSANKRYCRAQCRAAALKLRTHLAQAESAEDAPERRLVARLKVELDRVRGSSTKELSRLEVRDAIREFEATSPHSRLRRLQNITDQHTMAVEAFCNDCEPEGVCRTPECPLRGVSPLPLLQVRDVAIAVKPEGAWGPTNRATRLAQQRQANAVRWSKPGEKEAHTGRMKARWAQLTPEERRERVRSMVDARVASQARHFDECGCTRSRGHKPDCRFRRRRVEKVPA